MKEHTNKRSEWELEIAWTAVGNKGWKDEITILRYHRSTDCSEDIKAEVWENIYLMCVGEREGTKQFETTLFFGILLSSYYN